MRTIQLLRYELQVKKDRVFQVHYQALPKELKFFFDFLNSKPILRALLQELSINKPDYSEWFGRMQQARGLTWPDSELERVKLCLVFLEEVIKANDFQRILNIAMATGSYSSQLTDKATFFLEQLFLPFYEYLDSRIDEQSVALYLLEKFKARVEWFQRSELYSKYNNAKASRKGEEVIDASLREYLFDQGIDYPFSQPVSPSGKADVVAGLESSDPLILEVKLFDPNSGYDKAYVKKGFKQALTYSKDYNKPVGYLVVFNVSDKELRINTKDQKHPSRIEADSKTIFVITVDVYPSREPASKRTENPVIIEEDYLLQKEES